VSSPAGKLSETQIHEAAQILRNARQSRQRIERLPESCRPRDLEEGIAIARRVASDLALPIGGWKAGMPPEGRIFVGSIFAPSIYSTSPCPALVHGNSSASVEPEIAFVIGRDLPARATLYSEAEIRDAVSEARFAIEILGSRYLDPASLPFPEQFADGLNNQGLFVGPVLPHPFDRKLDSFHVKIESPNGAVLDREGKHPSGHPFPPVVWLAGFLNERGNGLRAGQIVTTGSYAGAVDVPLDVPLTFTYGDLGTLKVQFAAA